MIEPIDLLTLVIRPVLMDLGLHTTKAELLILGTACAESDCGRYLKQRGDGPALGIFQMERATHDDLYENFLSFRPLLRDRAWQYVTDGRQNAEEMIGNLYYATAMCRIHYLRDPEPIPDTLPGQAAYWKRVYNTEAGKGTVEKYIAKWNQFLGQGGMMP